MCRKGNAHVWTMWKLGCKCEKLEFEMMECMLKT